MFEFRYAAIVQVHDNELVAEAAKWEQALEADWKQPIVKAHLSRYRR